MRPVFCRNGLLSNYDADEASVVSGLACKDATRTQQHSKEEADINVIVRRFGVTGVLPQGLRLPKFEDFADVFDFQSAQNALVMADRAFMRVPSAIRRRFGNSPQEFIAFCSDEKNLPELRKMGLAVPEVVKAVVEPLAVRVVPEPAPVKPV